MQNAERFLLSRGSSLLSACRGVVPMTFDEARKAYREGKVVEYKTLGGFVWHKANEKTFLRRDIAEEYQFQFRIIE